MKRLVFTKDIKNRWITALRSGKYKQGSEYLYDSDTNCYCVLGVLGKVCGYKNPKLDHEGTFYDKKYFQKIPMNFVGEADQNELIMKLVTLNDEKKMSFKWFASYIERYL